MWSNSKVMNRGIVAIAVLLVSSAALADIINVPGDYPTIQAAILAALEGDEIIVAPGTYNEAIFFNGFNITLRSSDGPEVTIIDAAGLNSSVVRCILGEGPTTVLQGFTITGGMASNGGGMFIDESSPTVVGCILFQNDATDGAGVWSNGGSAIIGCLFVDNSAFNAGGAIYSRDGNPVITNCALVSNIANGGGGIFQYNGSPVLINCTIAGNTSGGGAQAGGGLQTSNGKPSIHNSIVWANDPPVIGGFGPLTVTYCDLEGGWPGSQFSILADPMFVDPTNGDYRLSAASPCIDSGNNAAVPSGVTTDLDGNPRFVDDPDTPDCPQPGADCGDPPIVDMGAYEFQVVALCPWDLDGNGSVGVLDVLALLAAWGSDPGGPPDFDGDGTVGILDLLTLLANWGECP